MSSSYTDLNKQFINGLWTVGQDTKHITHDSNPYDGASLLDIVGASQDDVDQAYAAAARTQPSWAAASVTQRSDIMTRAAQILDERAEEIIDWLIKESGSTRVKAQIEIQLAKNIILESATFPERMGGKVLTTPVPYKQSYALRRPLGVIGIIGPWNVPFHLTMRSLAPALALGNSVVVKPASDTPVTGGLLIGKIFEEAGIPKGTLNVVIGSGAVIGDYFVEHPTPRLISFTGSTPIGKGIGEKVFASKNIKKLALELGGNAPFVVLDDANLDWAAHAAIVSRFLHMGQICMSTNRLIVVESVYDQFIERLLHHAKKLKPGNPAELDTVIGPIINAKQKQGILDKIARAKAEGATAILEGETVGNVIPAHIFVNVDASFELFNNEIFGPVLPVIKAKDEAEALFLANNTEHGLSSAVFTENFQRGLEFAAQLEIGMTHINGITVDDEPNAPFGGEKNSGLGRFNGEWVLEDFTTVQWVTYNSQEGELPF